MFKVKLMHKIWLFNRKPFTLHPENNAYYPFMGGMQHKVNRYNSVLI